MGTWKKLREFEYDVVKRLWCEEGYPFADIVKILAQKGISVSRQALSSKAKKDKWVRQEKKERILTPTDINKFTENLEDNRNFKVDSIAILEDREARLNKILEDLSDIVEKSLTLKKDLLERVQKKLNNGEMDELKASKVLANLGLSMFNIAKIIGVNIEDALNKDSEEKDVTNQIQVYMPNNGRNKEENA